MENIWNKKDVPHKGWILVDVEDVADPTHKCEMCGNESVRYVHTVGHDEHPDLRVGCVCAEKMTGDYDGPRDAERALRNRDRRFRSFSNLRSDRWKVSAKGNFHRESFPYHATLMYSTHTVRLTDQLLGQTKWVEHDSRISALRTIFDLFEGGCSIAHAEPSSPNDQAFDEYDAFLQKVKGN